MIYPGLQIIVYKTEGYAYPVWHDVCWGGTALLCSIASFFAKVFSLNNPTTGEPSGFWRFQFQGI